MQKGNLLAPKRPKNGTSCSISKFICFGLDIRNCSFVGFWQLGKDSLTRVVLTHAKIFLADLIFYIDSAQITNSNVQ